MFMGLKSVFHPYKGTYKCIKGLMSMEPNRVATGTINLTIMQIVDTLIAFIFYLAITRALSQSEVGSLSLLLSVMAMYNTLTLLALNNAAIKYISEFKGQRNDEMASAAAKKIHKTILTISIISFLVTLTLTPLLLRFTKTSVTSVIATLLTAFILNLTSYYGGVMFGHGMYKAVAIQNIIYYSTSRFPALGLAYTGLKLPGVMIGFLSGAATCLIFSLIILHGKTIETKVDFPLRRALTFSLPIYLTNIIILMQNWLDVVILSSMAGLAVTGAYYMAVRSALILSILWMPLSSTLFPELSSMYGAKRKGALEKAMETSIKVTTLIVMPVSLTLAAASPTALSIAYGEKYVQAAASFAVIAFFMIPMAYGSLYSSTLQAIGETKPILTAGTISTAIYISSLLIFVRPLGSMGAAMSRATMGAATFIVLHLATKKHLTIKLDLNSTLKIIVLSMIIFSFILPIEQLQLSKYVKGVLEAMVFTATLIGGLKTFKPLNKQERETLKNALPTQLKFIAKLFS